MKAKIAFFSEKKDNLTKFLRFFIDYRINEMPTLTWQCWEKIHRSLFSLLSVWFIKSLFLVLKGLVCTFKGYCALESMHIHGLRTPFIFGQTISTHFGAVVPCPCFLLCNHYFYKKLSLSIHISNLELEFEFGSRRIRDLAFVCP